MEPKSGRWERHILPYNRAEGSKTVVDGKIYIVGGNNAGLQNSVRQILVINLDNNKIEALASMSCDRHAPGVIAYDGKIFVFGGSSSGPNQLSSCEVYHVKENRWEMIADMPTARTYVSVTELHGKIYVFGGENDGPEYDYPDLNVVECYDPERNIWESLPNMRAGKWCAAPAVGLNGKLFVGGGAREFEEGNYHPWELDDLEILDLRTNQWNLIEIEDDTPYIKNMFIMHRKFLPQVLDAQVE